MLRTLSALCQGRGRPGMTIPAVSEESCGASALDARDRFLGQAAAGIVFICALVAFVLSRGGAPAVADELVPNRTYAAGTAVEAPTLGVAFVMPAGWVGKLGQNTGNQVVMMGSNTVEGVGLAILQAGQSAAQVAATLAEPQDLGSGVVLRPTALPDTQGPRISARYQNNVYVGLALAVLGPTGNSVIFFFAGPLKNEAAYGRLLEGLARTTRFAAPAVAASQPEAPAAGGLDQQWSRLLAGQMLHYFARYNSGGGGGGMASHRVLHLCSDGRFSFSGDSSMTMNVPGANASGAVRSGNRGQWRIESPTQTTAVLVLMADGGSPMRWNLRYDGEKTFLNGQRWLRAASDACR